MMRKFMVLSIVFALTCFQATGVLAGPNPDNGPGCGLGKTAWADYKNQKNILPQLFMATTNDFTILSVIHWFGIALGTLGCTNDGVVMGEHKTTMFAELNFENLSQDMARGQGEHLASLATLLGVPAEQQPAFFALTQEKYTTLVHAGQTSTAAMLAALNEVMAVHPVLAKVSMK